MKGCEGIIMDALKNPTPFIRECLRQCCSALGCQRLLALLSPGTGCAGRAGASVLPILLCLLPCQL